MNEDETKEYIILCDDIFENNENKLQIASIMDQYEKCLKYLNENE